MKTIYKYKMDLTDYQQIPMPEGAEILSAQMQGEDLCVWAMVEVDKKSTLRTFEIYGTGRPVETGNNIKRRHIETVQDGGSVWHVFELI